MLSTKHTTWILLSDSTTCRLYQYKQHAHQLNLLHELNHPENKLRDIDITADKAGSYRTSGSAPSSAFCQAHDPKEIKIDNFSRDIAKRLNAGRNAHLFDRLILISPPRMDGLILHHMKPQVKRLITHNIKKDLLHLKNHQLIQYIDAVLH